MNLFSFLVGALWLPIFALIGTRDMPINGFISINQSGRKKNLAQCCEVCKYKSLLNILPQNFFVGGGGRFEGGSEGKF